MIKRISYLFRGLLHAKGSSLTKIVSLTIGLVTGILAFGYCVFETDYDTFHHDADRIYRIDYQVPLALMDEVSLEIPEIELSTVLSERMPLAYQYNGHTLSGGEFRFADTSFFRLFSFRLLSGDPQALQDLNKFFISEKLAHMLFGKADPIGKEVLYNHQPLTVGGVYENFPDNSFLKNIKALHSLAKVTNRQWNQAGENYSGYIRIAPNADPQEVIRKIQTIIDRHRTSEQSYTYALHPLKDLHLKYGWGYSSVYLVGFMGLAIVIISSLNYILISISSLIRKNKEIAIHKVNGANSTHIFSLFFWETVVLTLLSGLFVYAILVGCRPFFENLLYNDYADFFNRRVLTAIGLFFLVMLLFTGGIPARIFASIPVLQIFRQISQNRRRWKYILLWVQFFSTSMLLTLLLIFSKQYDYIIHKNLGYDTRHLYYTQVACGAPYPSMSAVKEEIKRLPFVTEATFVHTLPLWTPKTTVYTQDRQGLFESCYLYADADFFRTLQIPFIEGDTQHLSPAQNEVWVNEKFRDQNTPQSENSLSVGNNTITPRGVFRNFQVASLYIGQQPLVVFPLQEPDTCRSYYLLFKSPQMTPENITLWKKKLKEVTNQSHLSLYYYPYAHRAAYEDQKDMCTAVEILTSLALVIVFSGLFGFTGDEVARRTKEIAIRKVNGASMLSITFLLLRNICLLALCALPFGLAGAYYMGDYWLSEFAWRISLSWWILVSGAVLTLLIIVFTVLLKSRQGIKAPPAEALKNE